MIYLNEILHNPVSLLFALCVLLPLLAGLIRGITPKTVIGSLLSMVELVEFVALTYFSVILIKKCIFEESSNIYVVVNPYIPEVVKKIFFEKDLLAYIIVTPILLFLLINISSFLLDPFIKMVANIISKIISPAIENMSGFFRRLIGIIWNIPRAIVAVVLIGFMLNFSTYFYQNANLISWLNNSIPYRTVFEYTIKPVLHTNMAKDLPLIINNAFAREQNTQAANLPDKANDSEIARKLRNRIVIEYFNGVTLNDAVKSTPEIDDFARKLTEGKTTSKDKALAIYKWIKDNVEYDLGKAQNIAVNAKAYKSGTIEVFRVKKGICFDYAALFISMCKANKLKVQLATGLGYNGISWGDHAWNKVFSVEENRWINVDSTFGTIGNYFDKKDFYADHKYEMIREEW